MLDVFIIFIMLVYVCFSASFAVSFITDLADDKNVKWYEYALISVIAVVCGPFSLPLFLGHVLYCKLFSGGGIFDCPDDPEI